MADGNDSTTLKFYGQREEITCQAIPQLDHWLSTLPQQNESRR